MGNSGASAGRLVAVLKAEPRGPTAFPRYYLLDLVVDVEHVLGGRGTVIFIFIWDTGSTRNVFGTGNPPSSCADVGAGGRRGISMMGAGRGSVGTGCQLTDERDMPTRKDQDKHRREIMKRNTQMKIHIATLALYASLGSNWVRCHRLYVANMAMDVTSVHIPRVADRLSDCEIC